MSITTALLLNQPITLPTGKWRDHYMDNKTPNVPAHAAATRAISVGRVIEALRGKAMCVDEVVEATGLSKSTATFSLHELRDTGRAGVEMRWRKAFYFLQEAA